MLSLKTVLRQVFSVLVLVYWKEKPLGQGQSDLELSINTFTSQAEHKYNTIYGDRQIDRQTDRQTAAAANCYEHVYSHKGRHKVKTTNIQVKLQI